MSANEAKGSSPVDYSSRCQELKATLNIDFDTKLADKLLKLVMGEKDTHRRDDDLKLLSTRHGDLKLKQDAAALRDELKRVTSDHHPKSSTDQKKQTADALKLSKQIQQKVAAVLKDYPELKSYFENWNKFFVKGEELKSASYWNQISVANSMWEAESSGRAALAKLSAAYIEPAKKRKLIGQLQEIHLLIGLYSCAQFLFPQSTDIQSAVTASELFGQGTALVWNYLQARILLAQVERLEAQVEQEQKQSPPPVDSSPSSSPSSSRSSSDASEEQKTEVKASDVRIDEEQDESKQDVIKPIDPTEFKELEDKALLALQNRAAEQIIEEEKKEESSLVALAEFPELHKIHLQIIEKALDIETLAGLRESLSTTEEKAIQKEQQAIQEIIELYQAEVELQRHLSEEEEESSLDSFKDLAAEIDYFTEIESKPPTEQKEIEQLLQNLGIGTDHLDYVRLKYFIEKKEEYVEPPGRLAKGLAIASAWTPGFISSRIPTVVSSAVSSYASPKPAESAENLITRLIREKKSSLNEKLQALEKHGQNILKIQAGSKHLRKLINDSLKAIRDSLGAEIDRRKQIKEAEEKEKERKAAEQKQQEVHDAKRKNQTSPVVEDDERKEQELALDIREKDRSGLLSVFKNRKIPTWEWLLLGIILGGVAGGAVAFNFPALSSLLPIIIGLGSLSPFVLLGALGVVAGLAIAALFQSLPRTKENQELLWWFAVANTLIAGAGIALLIALIITAHPAIDTLVITGAIGTLTALLFLALIDFVAKKMNEAGVFRIEIEGAKLGDVTKSHSLENRLSTEKSRVAVPGPLPSRPAPTHSPSSPDDPE